MKGEKLRAHLEQLFRALLPQLRKTQRENLARAVVGFLLARRPQLAALARTWHQPQIHRVRQRDPGHTLRAQVKRLWRFLNNPRLDPVALQVAVIPWLWRRLGRPRRVVLVADWTFFDVKDIRGRRVRYQVFQVGWLWKKRVLPLLQMAYDRDALYPSQNTLEETLLEAVFQAWPHEVEQVLLIADRGFARKPFLGFLRSHGVDFILRVPRGMVVTEPDGRRITLGQDGLRFGQRFWHPGVRLGVNPRGEPEDIVVNLLRLWEPTPQGERPKEPWYLITSLNQPRAVARWYRRRMWAEESFRDDKRGLFHLHTTRIAAPQRLSRLLMVITWALAWLIAFSWPQRQVWLSPYWLRQVSSWGQWSVFRLALSFLDAIPPSLFSTVSLVGFM